MEKFFKRAFVSVKVFWMFILSLRLMIAENAKRCWWQFFRNFIEDFFNFGQKVYIISDIISSNMNYEIIWLFLDYNKQFL